MLTDMRAWQKQANPGSRGSRGVATAEVPADQAVLVDVAATAALVALEDNPADQDKLASRARRDDSSSISPLIDSVGRISDLGHEATCAAIFTQLLHG